MFVFLWSALLGCTIVPDDSFDSPPEATLKKITITANEGQSNYIDGLPVSSLTGIASHSGNKTTLQFEGSLDPFWLKPRIDKIEYEFSNEKLLVGMLITFVGGGNQKEQFGYNEDGTLRDALISYVTADGTDVKYEYDFFYRGASLDSIAKKVTLVKTTTEVLTGFFKKMDTEEVFSTTEFYSIFPYREGVDTTEPINLYCGAYVAPEDENHASYVISAYKPFNYLNYTSVVVRDNAKFTEDKSTLYTAVSFPYIDKQRELSLSNANNSCSQYLHGASYYRFVPQMNFNYLVLEMLNISEERYWVNREPNRLTPFLDLKIQFEYNYAK